MREMKNSGIEYVGEIPAHWNMHPLYYYFGERKHKNSLGQEDNLLSLSYGDIIRKDINSNGGLLPESFNTYNIIETGDIIIRPTDLQNDKRSLRTGLAKEHGIITSAYIALMPTKPVNVAYYHYLLHAFDVIKVFYNMGNGVRQGLNFSEFSRLMVLEPPIKEQNEIADNLDVKCNEINSLSVDIQTQINTLEHYKRSIITEAVTKGLNSNAEMKDSGIEYVGEIPAHWNMHPLYVYFGERKHKNSLGKENNLLSLSYGNIIRKDINTSDGLLPESFNTYNIIEAGDIIIRPTDLQNDKRSLRTGLAKEHGIITSAYIALMPTKPVNVAYYHYLLHAFDVMKVFYNMGNGVRQGLNFSEFSRLMVFEPPIKEQNEIADYLDAKCSEIDKVIADKNEQLSTIEEYKKSLIYEYVTGKKEVPTA
jgi:type I restriction enzyme S subunit